MPELKKLADKYADKGLVLVGPSLDAEATVKAFKAKHQIGFPLLAGSTKAAQVFGVMAYPTMFLVGKDGKVLWKGHFKDDVFIKKLEEALGAGAPAPAPKPAAPVQNKPLRILPRADEDVIEDEK